MENIIIEYELIGAESAGILNKRVQHYIGRGFQPFGNPYCGVDCLDNEDVYHYQAMVKYAIPAEY
jgi:hypothetical protein